MLTGIIDWSLRNRWLVLGLSLALSVAGLLSFRALPMDAFPDTTPTQVQINGIAPALGPVEIERRITIPMEQLLAGLPHLDEMRSISKFGLSQITLQFEDGVDIWFARQQVAERVSRFDVPPGIERPSLGPVATGLGEVFHYLVRSKSRSLEELRAIHDWQIAPQLRSVRGVAEVNTWGGAEKQWHVVVDPRRLQRLELSIGDLYEALEKNNANVGGGVIEHGGSASLVLGVGVLEGGKSIEEVVIASRKGVPIRVRDVAKVEVGREIRRGATTADGDGEVVLGLGFMLMGENSHAVTRALAERFAEIKKGLPADIEAEVVYERTDLVDVVLKTVEKNLFEGALLVIAVLFAFLGNFRAGLIVALSIPLSMCFAFSAMLRFGIAGTLMSLGAIDFGLVVDSSVILVENAERRLAASTDKSKIREIVRDAVVEVRKPTLFGELIIMVVYLPILTLEGVEGRLFRPMALTVIFALLGSAILSMTLMPVLASFALKEGAGHAHRDPWLVRKLLALYRPVLDWALRRTTVVLALAGGLVVGAGIAATELGTEFVPRLSEGTIVINTVRLAEVSLTESIRYGEHIEKALLEKFPDEIERIWTRTGTAEVATDAMGIELSDVFVALKPRDVWKRAKTQDELVEEMKAELAGFPGMRMSFLQPIEMRVNEMIAGVRSDVGIKLFGDDLDVLKATARVIEAQVKQIPGAADVTVEQITGQPVLEVVVDRAAIARYGIPAHEVLDVIEAMGTRKAGEVREGERRFPLAVRLDEEFRSDPEKLATVLVRAPSGERIPLGKLTKAKEVSGPTTIQREWGKRRIVVQANVRGRDLGGFVAELKHVVGTQVEMPAGYYVRYGGQFENLERARERLLLVVPIALALIFTLLFLTYRRLLDSVRIFAGVPFALVGGVAALHLRGLPFSISAAVGFIALSGVSVLGDMVLVSRVRQLLEEGVELGEAIREAATSRLRPVLMTSSVAAIGFLPMALNTGVGAEVQRPLAIVVIGGLLSSTLLTLVVLPVLYRVFGAGKVEAPNPLPVIATACLLGLLALPSPAKANPLSLPEAVQLALTSNPNVLSRAAEVEAAEARLAASDRLIHDNPSVQISAGKRFTREGVELDVQLSQPVEIAGQRGARIRSAEAELTAARARLQYERASIAADVRQHFARALASEARVRIEQEAVAINEAGLGAARERNEAGSASLIEVNTARIELGHARMALLAARRSNGEALEELALLVGVGLDESSPLEGTLTVPTASTEEGSSEARADLIAVRADLDRAEAESDLLDRGAFPTPSLGAIYSHDDGTHVVQGMIGFAIPLFDRSQAERAEARGQAARARIAAEAGTHSIAKQVKLARARVGAAREAFSAYDDEVLAAAESNLELVNEGYRSGRIGFIELMFIRRETLDARRAHVTALEEVETAEAELTRALGIVPAAIGETR